MLWTRYYRDPHTDHSITITVDDLISAFKVTLKSTKTDIVTLQNPEAVISKCSNDTPAAIGNTSHELSSNEKELVINNTLPGSQCYNLSFYTTAKYLGYSQVQFYVSYNTTQNSMFVEDQLIGNILLRAKRVGRLVDAVFSYLVLVLVIIATLGLGNDIDIYAIRDHLKKPKAPLVGLCCQFVFMPLLSYAIVYMFGYKGGSAIGLFTLGCAPGAGDSNMFTMLLNGDVSLSATMTTVGTVICLGTMPFWLYTLGLTLPVDEEIGRVKIPFHQIAISLATLFTPLAVGALIKLKLPKVSNIIRKYIRIFFILVILFFFSFGVYANLYFYESLTAELLFSTATLPYGGLIIGALAAWIFRMDFKLIKTLSLETGIQNVTLCILVVQSTLGQPESDLAIIAPMAASIMLAFPIFIVTAIYMIKERISHNKQKEKDTTDLEEDIECRVKQERKTSSAVAEIDEIHKVEMINPAFEGDAINGHQTKT
ncbi:hypothetical protein EB796_022004 [Bugula neritina]|uniref:Uncharacterized protein n=1 Tax=Bugula neritina TaxID=10212 RepID=A0A7J7J0I1_BUGNE|nr:hypothetical protein EB796_022004 [Bugula neritina]